MNNHCLNDQYNVGSMLSHSGVLLLHSSYNGENEYMSCMHISSTRPSVLFFAVCPPAGSQAQ